MQNYYNRFDPKSGYDRTLFLAGRGLQSAELNEVQDYAFHKLKGFGDALFSEGSVVDGCLCVVDQKTGVTSIESGRIYVRGAVRSVDSAELKIPLDQTVQIGVRYFEQTITELEDPSLRDPAVGTRNYQEPGACRLKVTLDWCICEGSDNEYPVFTIQSGVLIQNAPPPQLDAVHTALARYDRESNGSYVVSGLRVSFEKDSFVVSEGKAHVEGFEIELPHSLRLGFDKDPDIQSVTSDPYVYQEDADGKMMLKLNHTPVSEIKHVDGTIQKTVTITHGAYTGIADPLPDKSVLEIIHVQQGDQTFESGTDFKLKSGHVDWSLGGSEIAPGSSYQVVYRCRKSFTPENISDRGFEIEGAVEGSLMLVDYSWQLPRYDLITIDQFGKVRRIKGLSHAYRPTVPITPPGQLALAFVYNNWRGKPLITNHAIHAVGMADLQALTNRINDLYDLVACERLKQDAMAREPAAKKGVFVDPFFDDDLRDQGLEQSAAIVNQMLQLPIKAEVQDLGRVSEPWLLPFELEPIISQEQATSSMKINPYQTFEPVPADVLIKLNIDRWTEVQTKWSSPVTRRFTGNSSGTSQTSEVLNRESKEADVMRQSQQTFELSGFQPGEKVRIIFDGIELEVQDDNNN